MKLKDLLAGIEVLASTADLETEIPGVCYDSRKVRPGPPPSSASAFPRRPFPMSR